MDLDYRRLTFDEPMTRGDVAIHNIGPDRVTVQFQPWGQRGDSPVTYQGEGATLGSALGDLHVGTLA